MNAPVPLRRALSIAAEGALDRARIGGALRRIYESEGFSGAVEAAQGELRALAEQVQRAGGDLGGFVG